MNYGDLKLSIFIHYKYFVKTISSLISMSFLSIVGIDGFIFLASVTASKITSVILYLFLIEIECLNIFICSNNTDTSFTHI